MAPPGSSLRQVFGQTMYQKKKGGGGKSHYQRQFGGSGGNLKSNPSTVYRSGDTNNNNDSSDRTKSDSAAEYRRQKLETAKQVEADFGIERFVLLDNQQSAERRGWLYNLVPTTVRSRRLALIVQQFNLFNNSLVYLYFSVSTRLQFRTTPTCRDPNALVLTCTFQHLLANHSRAPCSFGPTFLFYPTWTSCLPRNSSMSFSNCCKLSCCVSMGTALDFIKLKSSTSKTWINPTI